MLLLKKLLKNLFMILSAVMAVFSLGLLVMNILMLYRLAERLIV
ncbi:MAG: hypothetical protein AB1637_02015 [Elusimicrobiota bacterium]